MKARDMKAHLLRLDGSFSGDVLWLRKFNTPHFFRRWSLNSSS